jgi:anti-sigma B factor antagonist
MDLSVKTRPGRGCLVLQVDGVLDLLTVPQMRDSLQQALNDGTRYIVLDLTKVRFLDSSALGMLAWLHHQLQQRAGKVRIVATEPIVLRVLELTSMDLLIPIDNNVDAAETLVRDGEHG